MNIGGSSSVGSFYGRSARSASRREGIPIRRYDMETFLTFYREALAYIIEINRNGHPFVEVFAQILLRKILTPFPTGYVDLQSPAGPASASSPTATMATSMPRTRRACWPKWGHLVQTRQYAARRLSNDLWWTGPAGARQCIVRRDSAGL